MSEATLGDGTDSQDPDIAALIRATITAVELGHGLPLAVGEDLQQ
jgi:hypothetical protein